MALFPFFMDISGKEGLIFGGGKHALEKVQRLKPYGPRLKVIAEGFSPEIEQLSDVTLIYRAFQESDLDTLPAFVIAAGEDPEENHRIAALCRQRRIPVNVVDDQEYCDFIFPSLIARGNLSVGICTNGASPSTGVLLKRKIEAQIPDHMEEVLDFLQEKRPVIAERITDKKKRFAFYYALSEACMEKDRPLSEAEFEGLLEEKVIEEK